MQTNKTEEIKIMIEIFIKQILYFIQDIDMILIIKEKPFINVISVLKRENNKICVQEGKSFRTMMFIQ